MTAILMGTTGLGVGCETNLTGSCVNSSLAWVEDMKYICDRYKQG